MSISKPRHRERQKWEQFLWHFNEKYVIRGLKYKNSRESVSSAMILHRIKSWWIWHQHCRNSQLIVSLLNFQKESKTEENKFILLGTFLKPYTFSIIQMKTSVQKDTPSLRVSIQRKSYVLFLARQEEK